MTEILAESVEWKFRPDADIRLRRNQCPCVGCNGQLDTGWECNTCGFDAQFHVLGNNCVFMDRDIFIDIEVPQFEYL